MGPVRIHGGNSFRTEIDTGSHRLIADEPVDAGGTGAGPTPYDFLSAALGACTSMTMHFLAKRDKIPLEGADIEITNDRMYAKDCADCASSSGYLHRFTVKIRLRGVLNTEQREKLVSAAKRCPVAKTLTAEIKIDEMLVEE